MLPSLWPKRHRYQTNKNGSTRRDRATSSCATGIWTTQQPSSQAAERSQSGAYETTSTSPFRPKWMRLSRAWKCRGCPSGGASRTESNLQDGSDPALSPLVRSTTESRTTGNYRASISTDPPPIGALTCGADGGTFRSVALAEAGLIKESASCERERTRRRKRHQQRHGKLEMPSKDMVEGLNDDLTCPVGAVGPAVRRARVGAGRRRHRSRPLAVSDMFRGRLIKQFRLTLGNDGPPGKGFVPEVQVTTASTCEPWRSVRADGLSPQDRIAASG